jgi:hypothetical protein
MLPVTASSIFLPAKADGVFIEIGIEKIDAMANLTKNKQKSLATQLYWAKALKK